MKGTNQKHSHCIALQGEVGQRVFCSIYDKRSTTCREFGIEWDRGVLHFNPDDLEQCMKARAAWGLPPISLEPTQPNAPDSDTPPLSDDFAA
jgi:Fe-S-cluster containining protein